MGWTPQDAHGMSMRQIRLAPGSHSSPREGMCVVELASLIAGEKFSDRPSCVCPVIAAFLRAWNDRASHADRQRLRPIAGRIVGSRGGRAITRRRRQICLDWINEELGRGGGRGVPGRLGMHARIAVYVGVPEALRLDQGVAEYAARLAFARRDADAAFAILECMLAIRDEAEIPAVELRRPDDPEPRSPEAPDGEPEPAVGPEQQQICDEEGRRVRKSWARLRVGRWHLRHRRRPNPARVTPAPVRDSSLSETHDGMAAADTRGRADR